MNALVLGLQMYSGQAPKAVSYNEVVAATRAVHLFMQWLEQPMRDAWKVRLIV